MAKSPTDSKVYDPPGLEKATVLRPEVLARLELLRLVYRPDRTAADAVKVCEELEKYISSGR
jgi:hypothetical protein